jgi:hypothetical protein
MVAGNREAFRSQEFRAGDDSAEGLHLLQSLLLELEHQLETEGTAAAASGHQGDSKRRSEFQGQLDRETVVRRLIQRFRRES